MEAEIRAMHPQAKRNQDWPRRSEDPSLEALERAGHCWALLSHFQPPELWESKFLLFQDTQFVVGRYSSPGNLIQRSLRPWKGHHLTYDSTCEKHQQRARKQTSKQQIYKRCNHRPAGPSEEGRLDPAQGAASSCTDSGDGRSAQDSLRHYLAGLLWLSCGVFRSLRQCFRWG